MNQEVATTNAASGALATSNQIAPHVAAMLAILLAEHYRDQIPEATLRLYGTMLAEYDAELLQIAAVECINQVKWFPKVNEVAEIIRMIQSLIVGGQSRRRSFEAKATVNARGELAEFKRRCKPATLAYVERERQKAKAGSVVDANEDVIAERIERAQAQLDRATLAGNADGVQYWSDYITYLKRKTEVGA